MPAGVALKDPKTFRLIGKPMKRLDTREKVNGTAKFGMDARVPGMNYASLERCPVFGGKVQSFHAEKAKAVRGVRGWSRSRTAWRWWRTTRGRPCRVARRLEVIWDEGPVAT